MRFLALAADYDGTLATNGQVNEATLAALKRLRESGRKLLLVSGRHLDDLCSVFPHVDLFDYVVAENGAVLYIPATKEEQILGDRPPDAFIQALRVQNVEPLGVGKVIVSTWEPHETTVLQAIRDLGLELQVIFNKGAVMVLPSGVNKASGLSAALAKLELSPHNVVAVGDAENDHAMLSLCEVSVAVANALPMVKERVDWVTQGSRGEGVTELIDRLIASDLQDMAIERHKIVMGVSNDGQEVYLHPYGTSVLLAGTSGGGKSTLATGVLECFYFRGADGKLNLKAQNLTMFVQLADGVDEDTWQYHLEQQDYSHWLQEAIKDDELAAEVADIEKQSNLSTHESRDRVKAAILQRYTLPA